MGLEVFVMFQLDWFSLSGLIAQLRPWHQPSRAEVNTIFTWCLYVRLSVCLCVCAYVTLSSRAPKQAAEFKFGTDITFRE